ncbi:MAG TPA: LysR family transcriptional regulator [Rubrivivax sp.]|nr:LysR family transcriptional regulator [Rubrivivax sp.]
MKLRTDLHFFDTLVRCGSLSAAARECDVTPSAASKWLAQLEARLGVRLVVRNTRRISLTHEGEVYLAEGRHILAEIEDLERSISSSQAAPIGLLKVHATLGFGRAFVAPAISKFSALHPALDIQLVLTDRSVSLAEGAVDLGIRFGPPPDGRVVARKIANHKRRIFAAPGYLKGRTRPVVPHDLTQHNCLIVRQDDLAYGQWHFRRGGQTQTVKVRGNLSSNDGAAVLTWALQGHGVLMRSEWDAAPFVRSGDLEVLLKDYALPDADIYLVYPQKRNLAAKVSVFVDFLAAHFAQGGGQERGRW